MYCVIVKEKLIHEQCGVETIKTSVYGPLDSQESATNFIVNLYEQLNNNSGMVECAIVPFNKVG